MKATQRTIVIHARAIHRMTMSKNKKAVARTKPCHEPYRFDGVDDKNTNNTKRLKEWTTYIML